MSRKSHWETAYSAKTPEQLGWYRPHLSVSLELIERTGAGKEARLIDVGGGASTMVDDLIDRGFEGVTVLDLAGTALSLAQSRLGGLASKEHRFEQHVTPGGVRQMYLYCRFQTGFSR